MLIQQNTLANIITFNWLKQADINTNQLQVKSLIGLVLFSLLIFGTQTHANQQLEHSLIQDIKSAQNDLEKTQSRIFDESRQLNQSINAVHQQVLVLRKETAAFVRANDEQTLGMDELAQRLNEWQNQAQYQTNLVQRFLLNNNLDFDPTPLKSLPADKKQAALLKQLDSTLTVANQNLIPQWQSSPLLEANGQTVPAYTLTLGPVHYFVSEKNAGIAQRQSHLYKQQLNFSQADQQALRQLFERGEAHLPIDVSNGRAQKKQAANQSITEHIAQGGIWTWPILAFALFASSIALFKALQLIRLKKHAHYQQVVNACRNQANNDQSPFSPMQTQLLSIAINTEPGANRDDSLFNCLAEQKHALDNLLGAVAITAAVAPLLGLLGTVSGMIDTFKLMTLFGAGDPAAVSGGISEALVTTELGLVVAIPALLAHAFLSRKSKSYYAGLEQTAIALSQVEPENQTIKGAA